MSSYIQFYLKKDDVRLPIGTFSRSNEVYQLFYDNLGHYGEYSPLKLSDLMDVKYDLREKIKRYKEIIENDQKDIELIMQANNDLDEKIEKVYDIRSGINETQEEILGMESAAGYLYALEEIIDEAKYREGYNVDEYVWFGIDAAWNDEEDGDE